MILYPAIDVFGGRVVRLRQGEYDDSTVYGDDPVAIALSFVEQGAEWVHMVDLDAARSAEPVNRPLIGRVAAALRGSALLQVGGGVRTVANAQELATVSVAELLPQFPSASAFVITDISRDGMLVGSDIEGLASAVASTSIPVIASGGVGELNHLVDLARVGGLHGVIVGKALYEGRFSVREAVEALR